MEQIRKQNRQQEDEHNDDMWKLKNELQQSQTDLKKKDLEIQQLKQKIDNNQSVLDQLQSEIAMLKEDKKLQSQEMKLKIMSQMQQEVQMTGKPATDQVQFSESVNQEMEIWKQQMRE